MTNYASINTDTILSPYAYRSDSDREATYRLAWQSLQPLSEGPEELEALSKPIFQLENGSKKASALFYRNYAISVGHVVSKEALGTQFTFKKQEFELTSQGLQQSVANRDIAVFTSNKQAEHALTELGPLAKKSYLLLVDENGEIKFMPILVDTEGKLFQERTAPGFSGALVVSHSFLGFNIAGIHVGEGRILDRDQIDSFCGLANTLPHDMHLPGWFEEQVKPTPKAAHFRTATRPKITELTFPTLLPLEKMGLFSDHTLYGSNNHSEDNFSQSKAQGRHFATNYLEARSIVENQLSESSPHLTVVKWTSVNKKRLTAFVESYRNNEKYAKSPKMCTVTLEKLGIAAIWFFKKLQGKIRTLRVTNKDLAVEVRFDWGLSDADEKTKKLFLSHFSPQIL
jgi:hypothetical protein